MKTVEIFKTNIQNNKDADKITTSLLSLYPIYLINFDLEDEENILRIETHKFEIKTDEIIKYIIKRGYSCKLIK